MGAGLGAAGEQQNSQDLEDEVASLKSRASEYRQSAAAARAELADQTAELEQRDARLEKREERQRAAAAARQEELDAREEDISATEQEVESNTITDGIWQLNSDFQPGLYRAPGGGGCYWALLGSADTSDIINNGGFSSNQTLQIDSPFFETNDCGDWTKIG